MKDFFNLENVNKSLSSEGKTIEHQNTATAEDMKPDKPLLHISEFKERYSKSQSCCFSGHRQISSEELPQIYNRLKAAIYERIKSGIVNFYAGGAMGFDMIAAYLVIQFKAFFPQITLTVVLPCLEHSKHWPAEQIYNLCDILAKADEIYYTSEEYNSRCMFERNKYLVDHSCCLIAYLSEYQGGTLSTIDYAYRAGIDVINIDNLENPETETNDNTTP